MPPTITPRLPISADFNTKHGAKTTSFAGWTMPTFFRSIMSEYEAVRSRLGLFDVSHMGRQIIEGRDAEKFLAHITTNNLSALQAGRAHYSALLNEEGGIIDDLIIYKQSETKFLVVNNAGNHETVCAWYAKQRRDYDLSITDVTLTMGQIAVQGPEAVAAVNKLLGITEELKYFSHLTVQVSGGMGIASPSARNDVMLSATGYTGERGYEIYAEPSILMQIWQQLIDQYQAEPCGLGARDLLRLEAGYCLHGNDISLDTSPYEAGLAWIVKNPGDFIGKTLASRRTKKLVGLGFAQGSKILARHGFEVFDTKHNLIGTITSGNYSARLGRGIALAYLSELSLNCGDTVLVKIRDQYQMARIAEPWFYRNIRKQEIQDIA